MYKSLFNVRLWLQKGATVDIFSNDLAIAWFGIAEVNTERANYSMLPTTAFVMSTHGQKLLCEKEKKSNLKCKTCVVMNMVL